MNQQDDVSVAGSGEKSGGMTRGAVLVTGLLIALLTGHDSAAGTLVEALSGNRPEQAQALIEQGGDVNLPRSDGTTPLMYAAHFGHQDLVAELLERGAAIDRRNDYGASALSEALIKGHGDIALMLLEAGADPDFANHEGETPLMIAARSGDLTAAQRLIEAGAALDAREQWGGQTALMWAAAQQLPEMIALLARHGADVNLHGFPRIWDRRITSEPRPKDMNKGGFSALQYAARQGCVACVRVLAAAGADLDATDPDRVTALNLALLNFHFDTAAALIEAGADVNKWDLYGRTPLYNAIDMNSLPTGGRSDIPSLDERTGYDIAVMLLERGANPDLQLKLPPPFRNAVFDRGSDKELTTGATPLLLAARTGDVASVELLLEHGARVDLPNKYGQTPLLVVSGVDYASSPTRGQYKTEAESIAILDRLLAAGADINVVSGDPTLRPGGNDIPRPNRNRQMHPANRGPDVIEGKNALHGAGRLGWNEIVRYLIDHGVQQQLEDASGRTPIDYAMARYSPAYNDAPPQPLPATTRLLQEACLADDGCVLEERLEFPDL